MWVVSLPSWIVWSHTGFYTVQVKQHYAKQIHTYSQVLRLDVEGQEMQHSGELRFRNPSSVAFTLREKTGTKEYNPHMNKKN